jgi:hypothetical protein
MPSKNERKQTNKVMRSEKQHATKNPNAIIIKNQTQTGTQKTPLIDRSNHALRQT